MKTLFQDCEGKITELNGLECETLLCIQVLNDETTSPGVFWLKIRGGGWHRFFLDTSCFFLSWTEQDEIDNSDLEDEDYPVIDIGERYDLKNRKIVEIQMEQIETEKKLAGCLTIFFSEGRLLRLKQSSDATSLTII